MLTNEELDVLIQLHESNAEEDDRLGEHEEAKIRRDRAAIFRDALYERTASEYGEDVARFLLPK